MLEPGDVAQIDVSLDPRGKSGHVSKRVSIITDDPVLPVVEVLVSASVVRAGAITARELGTILFSDPCAECHSGPAVGQAGGDLWADVCEMCHDDSGVAPLQLPLARSAEAIEASIIAGSDGRGMPAYAQEAGGPLDDAQVASLVRFLRAE